MMNRSFLALLVATAAGICAPSPVAAFSTGINLQSGKQGTNCNQALCHGNEASPAEPLVRFEKVEPPGAIAAGAIATFRFVVTSQGGTQGHAGLNVAAEAGVLGVVAGQGTQLLGFPVRDEITHTMPKLNDPNDEASWSFTWRAPEQPDTYTLFGSGNSVNRDFTSIGDRAASTTIEVEVVAAADTPTATASTTPTATATASPTPTDTPVASPTATPSEIPTATEPPGDTPTETATATVTPDDPPCTGDCDGSGAVTVDEIVAGVNIALGNLPIERCPAFDRNGDGEVTVEELVEGIQNALNGCP